MADFVGSQANFWVQSNALLRKNLTFQKRRLCANITIILIPAFFCTLCALVQYGTETYYVKKSVDYCKKGQSPYEITSTFPLQCPVPSPIEWPPLLQVPKPYARAVRSDIFPWTDLPDESCMKNENFGCPVTMLITGNNQTLAQGSNRDGTRNSNSGGLDLP
ncbi:hypothetical protein ACLB2K_052169 [Fragaria x ananassa]